MTFKALPRSELYSAYAELWNLENPDDRRSAAEISANYTAMPAGTFEEHWVGECEGRSTVVVSSFDRQGKQPPDNVEADVIVHPEFEEGAPPAALDLVDRIFERSGAKSVSVWSSDRRVERNKLLRERGFKVIQTVPVTRLEISSFTVDPFEAKLRSVREQGIRLTTVATLEEEGCEWTKPLYDATWEMVQDMPQTQEPYQPPLDQYTQMLKDRTTYVKSLMFVAVDGDRIVAYSRATPAESMPELVRTGLSGTVRSHRRRGLVTALKVTAIQELRRQGFKLLQTDNDQTNPMYHLNLELGFRDVWHWMQFERKAAP